MKHLTFRTALLLTITAAFVIAIASPEPAAARYGYCGNTNWCNTSTTNCPCTCPLGNGSRVSTCEEYAQGTGDCFFLVPFLTQTAALPELSEELQTSASLEPVELAEPVESESFEAPLPAPAPVLGSS